MTRAEECLVAIELDPDDRAAIAVYGDFLLERDDPFGKIIASALAGELDEALTADYEGEHFGWYAESAKWKTEWDPKTGFLRSILIEVGDDGEGFLRTLPTVPAARILRKLDFEVSRDGDSPKHPIPVLAEAPFPRSLRRLAIRGPTDFSELWPHIRFVEELDLEPVDDTLGKLVAPRLRRLAFHSFSGGTCDELAAADLPALEALELYDQHSIWGRDYDFRFPKLDRLKLTSFPLDARARATTAEQFRETQRPSLERLVRAPVMQRIGILDLSQTISVVNASVLAELASHLGHLREVWVGATCPELDRVLGARVKVVAPIPAR